MSDTGSVIGFSVELGGVMGENKPTEDLCHKKKQKSLLYEWGLPQCTLLRRIP